MAGAAELLRGGHAGGAGADHSDALAGRLLGRLRLDEAELVGLIGQRLFHRLDGDGESSRFNVQASSQGAGQMRP